MHSIINHADQVVNFLDWTTASLLGSSAVIIGQSMLARLRNEFVTNHQSGAIPASSGVPKAKGEPPKASKSPTKSTVEANEERARQQVLKRFGYV